MSMALMVEAMNTTVGNHGRKLVLIKLADNANDKGECWPSYQHVADQCEMGRSTVKQHIKTLANDGFIEIEGRNDGKSSNLYRLTLQNGAAGSGNTRSESDPVKNEPGQKNTPTRSDSDPLARSESDPRTSHSSEPVIEADDVDTPAVDLTATSSGVSENNHPAVQLDTTDTADQVLGSAANRQMFAMHLEWNPGPFFPERCKTMGINLTQFDLDQQEAIIGEFRSYWEGQNVVRNQGSWEHKLAQQLQRESRKPQIALSGADRRAAVTREIMGAVKNNDLNWR
ncbi:MAG: DnaT-like ssDNA-binding domain-containing protein [Amphritea sp.]|nr:DnaT-like ssDNA-binding domain-containing protein [Amphritea sp.]